MTSVLKMRKESKSMNIIVKRLRILNKECIEHTDDLRERLKVLDSVIA